VPAVIAGGSADFFSIWTSPLTEIKMDDRADIAPAACCPFGLISPRRKGLRR
jgi:hypothetical protein